MTNRATITLLSVRFETQICIERNNVFLDKWPISVLRQEMYKVSLKHFS